MAKIKIIHLHLFCIFICSSLFGQDTITLDGLTTVEKRACLKELYDSQIGVRETGANMGIHVAKYLKSVGLKEGYAWCAGFVSWCYQNAGIQTPKSAWVPSYAIKGKRIYHRGKYEFKIPQKGDVFMIWSTQLNRPAHIGFIDQWKDQWVITVEGNTNNNGSREGDGVYRKRRLKKQIWAVSDFISTTSNQCY
ncbi:CHAP domain-containing protein [Aquimarina longa]|uniref:CHAP domain-containing protein n=1 Tax=Aquimarina longa TaxID=1080221 RepID=UPI0007820120|nr:CHAP domain-containing protein [Aquimarina longa]